MNEGPVYFNSHTAITTEQQSSRCKKFLKIMGMVLKSQCLQKMQNKLLEMKLTYM